MGVLDGQVAIVTGGGSGIGRETAQDARRRGRAGRGLGPPPGAARRDGGGDRARGRQGGGARRRHGEPDGPGGARRVDARDVRPRRHPHQQRRALEHDPRHPLGTQGGLGQRARRQRHRRLSHHPGGAARHDRARRRHHRHRLVGGGDPPRPDGRRAVQRGQGGGAEPHGTHPQRASRQGHPRHHHPARRGGHAHSRQAPAAAGRQGARRR